MERKIGRTLFSDFHAFSNAATVFLLFLSKEMSSNMPAKALSPMVNNQDTPLAMPAS
jgi:hypothetical protein